MQSQRELRARRNALKKRLEYLNEALEKQERMAAETMQDTYESVKIQDIDEEIRDLQSKKRSLGLFQREKKKELQEQIDSLIRGKELLGKSLEDQKRKASDSVRKEIRDTQKELEEVESKITL